MRGRRKRRQMAAIDQINVTPLLDLTFLLLIVFMITMPLMEYGTNISPPEKENAPKTQLLLRADGSRTYNDVIELMALIRHAGFDDVSLVTQAEGK